MILAGFPHDDLGGVVVVAQKPDRRPSNGRSDDRDAGLPFVGRDDAQGAAGDRGNARGEPVDAVDRVHRLRDHEQVERRDRDRPQSERDPIASRRKERPIDARDLDPARALENELDDDTRKHQEQELHLRAELVEVVESTDDDDQCSHPEQPEHIGREGLIRVGEREDRSDRRDDTAEDGHASPSRQRLLVDTPIVPFRVIDRPVAKRELAHPRREKPADEHSDRTRQERCAKTLQELALGCGQQPVDHAGSPGIAIMPLLFPRRPHGSERRRGSPRGRVRAKSRRGNRLRKSLSRFRR